MLAFSGLIMTHCSLSGTFNGDLADKSKTAKLQLQVIYSSPAQEETGVDRNTSILVSFNKDLNPLTVLPQNFSLYNATDNSAIALEIPIYNPLGRAVTVKPSGDLAANQQYRLEILPSLQDFKGDNLAEKYILSFTTGSTTDETAPEIVSHFPADDEEVPVNSMIAINFTEDMDPNSIVGALQLFKGNTPVAGAAAYISIARSAVFVPQNNLVFSSAYQLRLNPLLVPLDLAGNALASTNFTLDFTTQANQAPVSVTSGAFFANSGNLVTLPGNASYDPDGFQELTYKWSQLAGPSSVGFSANNNTSAGRPVFLAESAGTYEFELKVNDGLNDSEASSLQVYVDAQPSLIKNDDLEILHTWPVVLVWSQFPGIEQYQLQVSTQAGFTVPSQISELSTENHYIALTASDYTLETWYYYRVRGVTQTPATTSQWSEIRRFRRVSNETAIPEIQFSTQPTVVNSGCVAANNCAFFSFPEGGGAPTISGTFANPDAAEFYWSLINSKTGATLFASGWTANTTFAINTAAYPGVNKYIIKVYGRTAGGIISYPLHKLIQWHYDFPPFDESELVYYGPEKYNSSCYYQKVDIVAQFYTPDLILAHGCQILVISKRFTGTINAGHPATDYRIKAMAIIQPPAEPAIYANFEAVTKRHSQNGSILQYIYLPLVPQFSAERAILSQNPFRMRASIAPYTAQFNPYINFAENQFDFAYFAANNLMSNGANSLFYISAYPEAYMTGNNNFNYSATRFPLYVKIYDDPIHYSVKSHTLGTFSITLVDEWGRSQSTPTRQLDLHNFYQTMYNPGLLQYTSATPLKVY